MSAVATTQESDDGFVEVTCKHGKGKQNGNKEPSSQPKSNVNGKASTSQPKEYKEAASQSNSFFSLEEDNGNPMDDLVDEMWKKVEVPPKKTSKNTGI
ncbi:hypothetical protein Tco_0868970 [Tanacetum coccineum]